MNWIFIEQGFMKFPSELPVLKIKKISCNGAKETHKINDNKTTTKYFQSYHTCLN